MLGLEVKSEINKYSLFFIPIKAFSFAIWLSTAITIWGFIPYFNKDFTAESTQIIKKLFISIFNNLNWFNVVSRDVPAPKTKIGFWMELYIISFEFAILGKFNKIFFEYNFPSFTRVILFFQNWEI